MNAKEALKALLEGKKVTCSTWAEPDKEYIFLNDKGYFETEDGGCYTWDEYSASDNWQIFGTLKTYTRAEALKLLAEGKKITHQAWEEEYLFLSQEGMICDEDDNPYDWNDMNQQDGFIVKE